MTNKNYIITGATALFRLGLINFNPSYISIEIEHGTKMNNRKKLFMISRQSCDTINLGVIEFYKERTYSPERLYIELENFPLENTFKSKAIRNLESSIVPEIVKEYYDKLKDKRPNINNEMIEKFLAKRLKKY